VRDTSNGQLFSSLAKEGGFPSTLWAGPEQFSRQMKNGQQPIQGTVRKSPVALKLGFASDDYSYLVDLGLPPAGMSSFGSDPEIKQELVWHGEARRPSMVFAKRHGPLVSLKDNDDGEWRVANSDLASFDSMMTHGLDPRLAPELLILREKMRDWRFYDHFRTDQDAPARQSQVGTHTPVLSPDGHDLAAAIQTIRDIGSSRELSDAFADAFPDARLDVRITEEGRFLIYVAQHGLLRDLSAQELSDGTLRYILLLAALFSPRPPEFLVLNEPETSLHEDLLPPLARLIARASETSQILVISHSRILIDHLYDKTACELIPLEKALSETEVPLENQTNWEWPKR